MSLKILVVDDEKDMLALLSRYITEETDYQVKRRTTFERTGNI